MHPIAEVRVRAAESLLFKLKFGLASAAQTLHTEALVDCALQCVDLRGGSGSADNTTASVLALDILMRVATEEEGVRRMVALGGVPVLQAAAAAATDSEQGTALAQKAQLLLRQLLCVQPFLSSDAASAGRSAPAAAAAVAVAAQQQEPPPPSVKKSGFVSLPTAAEPVLPQGGVSFNWVHLLESDADRLVDTALALSTGQPSDPLVSSALAWLGAVALRDYPPEVFLQRPQVMKVHTHTPRSLPHSAAVAVSLRSCEDRLVHDARATARRRCTRS